MPIKFKIYTVLTVLFSILLIIGNMTYQKFISLNFLGFHRFEISVGAILYPLTFLISDLLAEFFDKKLARFCLKIAITMNIIVALIIMFMDKLPATPWSSIDQATFHQVFGAFGIAFIGSMMACYLSQSLDVLLYLNIKKITKNKYLWLRNNISTGFSLFIDTVTVICFLSWFNSFPKEHMFQIIQNSYLWKLFFSISCTPLFYVLVYMIQKLISVQNHNLTELEKLAETS
jgi:uncharacterized integral membrane protein (TIGR00697 family)